MPTQTSYPGVYIEEISSGVHTITGVATSVTAFIGRALKGEVDEPVSITSFGDFERAFGGLWTESTMSYAIQDFYQNGGSQAIVVRVYKEEAEDKDGVASVTLGVDEFSPPVSPPASPPEAGQLKLLAISPGAWANNLYVSIDHDTKDVTAKPSSPPLPQTNFNLVVYEKGESLVKVEEYLSVSLTETDLRFLPRLLEQQSERLKVGRDANGNWETPSGLPAITLKDANKNPVDKVKDGSDGLALGFNEYKGSPSEKTGLYALDKTDLFNLLCIPPPTKGSNTFPDLYSEAADLCVSRRAMLLVDPPIEWGSKVSDAVSNPTNNLSTLLITGTKARNAALYYPLIRKSDPLRSNQIDTFVPCGAVAGMMAKTDTNRGVWKAPAGTEAALSGVRSLQVNLNDLNNGDLNKIGVNCLRTFPLVGTVIWGARTMRGADQLADEWKYVPVRRTALFIEETLFRATKWVVFEPNDEPLWAQIRLNIGAFMHDLFRKGAFQGKTPKEAYLVKCDSETTTQNDINSGVVNILVGFAPLKLAEFVIIKIQQLAGQIES